MPWKFSFHRRRKSPTDPTAEEPIILPPVTNKRRFRKDVPYILPTDADEIDRLDFQHLIIRAALKSNYVAPINMPARILDVGCGSGQWSFDMCTQFPQSQVIGIDLEPGTKTPPDNFMFTQANIINGLPFEANSFDFVHQRFLLTALPLNIWPQTLNEMARVTVPGGWVELIEGSEDIKPLGPAMQRMLTFLGRFAEARGLNTTGNLPRFLDSMLAQAGLEQVTMKTFDVPLGPWGGQIGDMMSTNLYNALKGMGAAIPALLGVPATDIEEILSHLRDEWEQDHATYKYYIAYAQKPDEPVRNE